MSIGKRWYIYNGKRFAPAHTINLLPIFHFFIIKIMVNIKESTRIDHKNQSKAEEVIFRASKPYDITNTIIDTMSRKL